MTSESTVSETAVSSTQPGRRKKSNVKKSAAKTQAKSKTNNSKSPRANGLLSQKAQKQKAAQIPTSQLTVEHYADRPNPELSWAAAILKRAKSTERQRKKAAEIMSRAGTERAGQKLSAFWQSMTPKQKRELAARGGRRRWEIWREEQAALHGNVSLDDNASQDGVGSLDGNVSLDGAASQDGVGSASSADETNL